MFLRSLVKLNNSILVQNFAPKFRWWRKKKKKRSSPHFGSTSVWNFEFFVAKWVLLAKKPRGQTYFAHFRIEPDGAPPPGPPKSTPMSACTNSSTNFSQNLRTKSNNACLSNYHGKRYANQQNLETKFKFFKFISDTAKSKLYDNFTLKTYINLLNSLLSRTLGVMFKVKQLITKNYLLLLHITLFLVHFNSYEVIRS